MTEGFRPQIVVRDGEVVDLDGNGEAVGALQAAATALSACDEVISTAGGDLTMAEGFQLRLGARRHPSMPTLSVVRGEEDSDD